MLFEPFGIGYKTAELDHTAIVRRAAILTNRTRGRAAGSGIAKERIPTGAGTVVLLALHGAQPLLGFPQYTILVRQTQRS